MKWKIKRGKIGQKRTSTNRLHRADPDDLAEGTAEPSAKQGQLKIHEFVQEQKLSRQGSLRLADAEHPEADIFIELINNAEPGAVGADADDAAAGLHALG